METAPERREFADGAELAPAFAAWTADGCAPLSRRAAWPCSSSPAARRRSVISGAVDRAARLDARSHHARGRAKGARRQPALERASRPREFARRPGRSRTIRAAGRFPSATGAGTRRGRRARRAVADARRSRRARHGRRRAHRFVVSHAEGLAEAMDPAARRWWLRSRRRMASSRG